MKVAALFLIALLGLCSVMDAKIVNVGMKHQYLHNLRHSTFNPDLRDKLDSYRRDSAAEPNNNAMGGNILPVGIYWMTVEVGTPPQMFSAAVDSGSGDLIIPSQSCVGCHPDMTGEYDPSASTTSTDVGCNTAISCFSCENSQCTFSNSYQTCNLTDPQDVCTVSGPLYNDTFSLGGQSGYSPFGAITNQTANFQQFFVIDAVVGFIPHLSSWGGQSLFQTLVDGGKYDNIFAMCMNPDNGGVITLGGTDDRLQFGDFMYTPQTDAPYFEIRLSSFTINKNINYPVSFGTSKFIVDSGTNVLLVRSTNFENIMNGITSVMCAPGFGFTGQGVCDNNGNFFDQICYPYTAEQIAMFPDVTLNAQGENGANVPLVMNGGDYVVANGTTGDFCYGIKDTGTFGLDIIGDSTMQKYYVSFDVENHRLGWADVDMGYCMKIKNELINEERTFMEEVHNKEQ